MENKNDLISLDNIKKAENRLNFSENNTIFLVQRNELCQKKKNNFKELSIKLSEHIQL